MLKPKYIKRGKDEGPHYGDDICIRCGKPMTGHGVSLELDLRTNEYHDFGGVPEDKSQGNFEFGPDCAKIMRARARAADR